MADTHWPAAFPCPECHKPSGRALNVASHTPGKILVALRCRDCAHQWSVERDTPTFAIRRQRDRRREPRGDDPVEGSAGANYVQEQASALRSIAVPKLSLS